MNHADQVEIKARCLLALIGEKQRADDRRILYGETGGSAPTGILCVSAPRNEALIQSVARSCGVQAVKLEDEKPWA